MTSRAAFWGVGATFPPIYRGEGNAEPLSELLLGEVELGADGAKGGWIIDIICHICYICYSNYWGQAFL